MDRHDLPIRAQGLLAGVWLGGLLAVAFVAAPSAFQVLDRPAAGAMVGRLFAVEATSSLLIGVLVVLLERWRMRQADDAVRMNRRVLLALGAVFCTVAGYYALQPLMDSARAGQGRWTFGQLHAVSLGFYGLKLLLVAALAVLTTVRGRRD